MLTHWLLVTTLGGGARNSLPQQIRKLRPGDLSPSVMGNQQQSWDVALAIWLQLAPLSHTLYHLS